jgi:hypothetical protein
MGEPRSGSCPWHSPPQVHVVDLDDAGQLALGIAFEHALHELVLDAPGGRVADAERRLSSSAEMPLFCWISRYRARNQVVSGNFQCANTDSAVSEV